MTRIQAVERTDSLCCNALPREVKLGWIHQLEWQIWRLILACHENPEQPEPPGEDMEAPLLAPEPFDSLYISWLQAQIHLHSGEISRYNISIALFNTEYAAFESWYQRSFPPRSPGDWRL